MKILVTGGCGFTGSNVLNFLLKKYPEYLIVNVDKLDYCSSESNVSVPPNAFYEFHKMDICDLEGMKELFKRHDGFDIVMHFAASTHVDNSFQHSLQFSHDNIIGTHTLLEVTRLYGMHRIKKFIHVSTDEVLGETTNTKESIETSDYELKPSNPYAATKAAAECLARSYEKSFRLPLIITRSNNVYGPRQYPEKIIPLFIMRLLKAEKCPIHGDGLNARRYLYIDDVVHAYDLILHHGQTGVIYNIATKEHGFSNLDVAEMLIKELKGSSSTPTFSDWIEHVPDRPFNDAGYYIKADRLQELGWQPKTPLAEGIQKTIEWFKSTADNNA